MRLFNTMSRQIEEVVVPEVASGDRPFGMYVCGPTVQDAPHFGHARAALVPDVVRRVLEHKGITVLHVRNITDVDDKIIAKAQEQGIDPAAVSETYTRVYEDQMARLGIKPPTIGPRATGHLIEMIDLVVDLIKAGLAYEIEGDVFFRVRKFDGYLRLSNRSLDDMLAGARVEPDPRKEDPADFALWKAAKPGEPSWTSPWGPGRPGWHTECVAMGLKYLSGGFDLHTGGSDLVFPHHENEIAQAEALTGKPFARMWLHNGMLNLDGEKMSKSLGNVISLQEALDGWGGPVLRLYYLQSHYRSDASFGSDLLEDTAAGWKRITTFVDSAPANGTADEAAFAQALASLEDDLNTPEAIAVVFEQVKAGNIALSAGDTQLAANAAATARTILALLGFEFGDRASGGPDVAPLVDLLLDLRAKARDGGDFATSDQIRATLGSAGVVVEDSRDGGVRWRLA